MKPIVILFLIIIGIIILYLMSTPVVPEEKNKWTSRERGPIGPAAIPGYIEERFF